MGHGTLRGTDSGVWRKGSHREAWWFHSWYTMLTSCPSRVSHA
jgi:hypothetical protein